MKMAVKSVGIAILTVMLVFALTGCKDSEDSNGTSTTSGSGLTPGSGATPGGGANPGGGSTPSGGSPTSPIVINTAAIVIIAPVKGATPSTTATVEDNGNFTIGSVSWSPTDNPFKSNEVYSVSVALTAKSGYTFTGLASVAINGQNATVSNNIGSAVTLSYTFSATDTKTVKNIKIKSQPTKLTYTHGDTLDLTGLAVTLTHDDNTTEDVTAANFADKNVTANPSAGNSLICLIHNRQPVKITYGSLTCNTNNLTVNKATPTAADFDISGLTQEYDGNPKTVTINPKEGKSDGTVTVKYNGNTTKPSARGTYTVTFDIAATTNYNAVNGLSAGTMTITTAVTFNSVIANGSASQITTQLTLTFNQAITGLSANDITLSGVSGVKKVYLYNSESTYTLGISGFSTSGDLSVAVAKSGYTISDSPKTVTIYYLILPIEMVSIPAGTFTMGSPTTEPERYDDETQHSVTLSAFSMSKYLVTQAQYKEVMGEGEDRTITDYGKGNNYPIYYVNWYDAIVFCNKLSIKKGLNPVYSINGSTNPTDWGTVPTSYNDPNMTTWNTAKMDKNKNGYRLPTEEEWEYACRAGTTTPFNTGNNITTDQANYYGYSPYNGNAQGVFRGETTPVVRFAPNAWDLYDMHGNLSEWCWDWHNLQPPDTVVRVARGGNWYSKGQLLRSAYRGFLSPSQRFRESGFRLVRSN
jgi:formylglycine-generating enzyme required for sulfatase activity